MQLPGVCPLCGVLALDPGHPTNDRGANCTCWDCGHCRNVAQLENDPGLVQRLQGTSYRCRKEGEGLVPGSQYPWTPLVKASA